VTAADQYQIFDDRSCGVHAKNGRDIAGRETVGAEDPQDGSNRIGA